MGQLEIRRALETAAAGALSPLPISWGNVSFAPPAQSSPYAEVFLLFAEPENQMLALNQHTERGYMQVNLRYPQKAGMGAVVTKAEAVRDIFSRGAVFTFGATKVFIQKTPEIQLATQEEGRLVVPIKIRFYSIVKT